MKNKLINPFLAASNRETPETTYEIFQVPANAPYVVQLKNMPKYYSASDSNKIKICNLSTLSTVYEEVYTSNYSAANPGSGQYVVDYRPNANIPDRCGTGQILFNAAQAGVWCITGFKSLGSINLSENTITTYQPDIPMYLFQNADSRHRNILRFIITPFSPWLVFFLDHYSGDSKLYLVYSYTYARNGWGAAPSLYASINNTQFSFNFRNMIELRDSDLKLIVIFDGNDGVKYQYVSNEALASGTGTGFTALSSNSRPFIAFSTSVKVVNMVYFFGCSPTTSAWSNQIWKYNLDTNAWTQLANFPSGISQWARGTCVYDGYGTIYGIGNEATGSSSAFIFNIFTETATIWNNGLGNAGTVGAFYLNNGAVISADGKSIVAYYQTASAQGSYSPYVHQIQINKIDSGSVVPVWPNRGFSQTYTPFNDPGNGYVGTVSGDFLPDNGNAVNSVNGFAYKDSLLIPWSKVILARTRWTVIDSYTGIPVYYYSDTYNSYNYILDYRIKRIER